MLLSILFAMVCTNVHAASSGCSGQETCAAPDGGTKLVQGSISYAKKVVNLERGLETQQTEVAKARVFSDALKAMSRHTSHKDTASFLSSLRICTSCENYRRFGEEHDGGYLTCLDGLAQSAGAPKKLSSAFSLGVEQHDKWSADVSQALQLPVNQFDCTVAGAAPCPTCKFYSKCLKSANGNGAPPGKQDQSWTFSEMLANTGQGLAADHSVLLKIDIEGAEWPYFAEEDLSVLNKFQQIIVEFHWLDKVEKHSQYLQAVQKIQQSGLQVAHLHGNNFAGLYTVGDASVPNVLEVTFIRGPRTQCQDDQEELAMDSPNNPSVAELPPAHIPAST